MSCRFRQEPEAALVSFLNLLINGLIEGLVIALPALAMTLVMGVNRFPNAATGDFMTAGAYVAVAAQTVGLTSLTLASVVGALAAAVISALSYQLIFRKLARQPMIASLLASIGLGFFVRSVISFFWGHDPRVELRRCSYPAIGSEHRRCRARLPVAGVSAALSHELRTPAARGFG